MTTSADCKQWQLIGERKRQEIQNLLPTHWKAPSVPSPDELKNGTQFANQHLSEKEIEITESPSAPILLDKIARGELSAVDVTQAFCHRATIAHQLTNCLSEVMFDQAVSDAQALDNFYKVNGTVVGPLHGLPVSLKDQFRVRDIETSLGFIAWLGKTETAETESWLVKKLRKLGAIIYVKTNVPTSLMAIETNNNIIGYTLNAANRLLSSGGSSGGEASLIAMGGSLLGLGSDMGASIRLPAAYNGIVGLRPSIGRLPYLGVANSMLGHQTMESVIGPIGRNIQDLRFIMKTLLQTEPWLYDPKVLRLPWREADEQKVVQKIESGTLTLAVLRCDGTVMTHPPVERVLDEAIEKLKAHSYEVIDWEPPAHSDAYNLAWQAFTADAGQDIHNTLSQSGEVPVSELASVYGEALGHLPSKTVNDLWDTQRQQYEYQAKYLKYWESTRSLTKTGEPVDAILLPVAPTVGYERSKGIYAGYTAVFNILDYSAATIRGGVADGMRDNVRDNFQPLGELDATLQHQYDPNLFNGSPIGIQIVCRRLEEEKLLVIAEHIEKIVVGN